MSKSIFGRKKGRISLVFFLLDFSRFQKYPLYLLPADRNRHYESAGNQIFVLLIPEMLLHMHTSIIGMTVSSKRNYGFISPDSMDTEAVILNHVESYCKAGRLHLRIYFFNTRLFSNILRQHAKRETTSSCDNERRLAMSSSDSAGL